jgi:hypothetical protein
MAQLVDAKKVEDPTDIQRSKRTQLVTSKKVEDQTGLFKEVRGPN